MTSTVTEVALSLNFRARSDRPGVVRDLRTEVDLPAADLDTKIAIYEDRVSGWFFRIADELRTSDPNSGYVVLQIALSQVEGLEQYRRGDVVEAHSKSTFVNSLMKMFSIDGHYRPQIDRFYKAVRCGLFHDGFTKSQVHLGAFPHAFGVSDTHIEVNPWLFFDAIRAAFDAYARDLKDAANAALRGDFEKRWDAAP